MKKTAAGVVITIVILSCGALSAAAQSRGSVTEAANASVRQTIVRLEHLWLNSEYNPAVLRSIPADDFVHVLPEGFVSKQRQIAFVRTHVRPRLAEHKFEKLDVRVYGNAAVANGTVLSEFAGKNGMQRRAFFTDAFAFRNARWQAGNAQETPVPGKRSSM